MARAAFEPVERRTKVENILRSKAAFKVQPLSLSVSDRLDEMGADEVMYRTGCFGGPGIASSQPSRLGGTEVLRPLRLYGQDGVSGPAKERYCTKLQPSTRKLGPGLAVRSHLLMAVFRLHA